MFLLCYFCTTTYTSTKFFENIVSNGFKPTPDFGDTARQEVKFIIY